MFQKINYKGRNMCNSRHDEHKCWSEDDTNTATLCRREQKNPVFRPRNRWLRSISLVTFLLSVGLAGAVGADTLITYDLHGRDGGGVNFINAVRLDLPNSSQQLVEPAGGNQHVYPDGSERGISGPGSTQPSMDQTSEIGVRFRADMSGMDKDSSRLSNRGYNADVVREQSTTNVTIQTAQVEVEKIAVNATDKLENTGGVSDRTETIGVDFVSGSPYAVITAVFGLLALIFVARRV